MKRRKARPVNRADFDLTSLISRADAVRVIVQEVAQHSDRAETVRSRVSKRIGYAVNKGLKAAGPGHFRFGQLIAWAQDTWPGNFTDWPVTRPHVVFPATGTARLPPLVANGIGRVLPQNTLEGWRSYASRLEAEHQKLAQENQSIRRENVVLRREVETLSQYKVRADQTRAKRSEAGKKGGRGRIREN